jgi:hypothetical protein
MILKDLSAAHAARVSQTARRSGEGKNAMAQPTARPKIAPPSAPVGAPNMVLPFTSRHSRVTIHSRSTRGPRRAPARWGVTRHSRSSRNARNSLKTNTGDLFYPAHFSAPNRVRRHADFWPSTAAHASTAASCPWKRRDPQNALRFGAVNRYTRTIRNELKPLEINRSGTSNRYRSRHEVTSLRRCQLPRAPLPNLGAVTRKICLRFAGGGPTIRLSKALGTGRERGAEAAVSSGQSRTGGAVPRGQQREVFREC